jgi:hypothetical protein
MKDGLFQFGDKVQLCSTPQGDVSRTLHNIKPGQIGQVRAMGPDDKVFVEWSQSFGNLEWAVNLVLIDSP